MGASSREVSHVQPKSWDPNSLQLGTQGHMGVKTQAFSIYILQPFQKNKKMVGRMAQGHGVASGRSFNPRDRRQGHAPLTSVKE
jgi:hypothetical protein